ncbi:DUF2336 domain-containing protein [Cohaesibacter intestini]|uniref:DUF2336 domain-containing protein n=1 Tax=Cohaesibacter intestini TaxID=2211145 RepID=UPI000DEBC626|nr:DUF2336 domain-containing protein [Cohaesibacter intestini]
MLDTITDLAREKSSDKRRELLGRVADMFFDGAEHHSQKEAVIFRDIVLKMLDDVDLEGRAEFSERAAPHDSLPSDVARQLAQDDVAVAGPMLQHSPVLTDDDFVAFSQSLSPSHLESIAQRESLSGTVTDALIENGTREVWHKVTQNKGAEITSKGFDKLVDNASGDQILQASLSARPDITIEAAKNLLPLLPQEGKQRLVQLFEQDSAMGGELLDMAQKRVTAEKLDGRKGRIETKLLITDVKEGKVQLSDAIIQLAEADRSADLISLLAAMADMDEPLVSNAFYQENDDPIAILCKSLDVSVDAFTRVMRVRCDKLKLPLSAGGRSIIRYKELDISSSQRAMRFVQMRKNLGQAS